MLSGDLTRTAELALAEGEEGAARRRLRALPAGPADARLDGRRASARRVDGLRARVGRVEARRHPHPGPPPRRRGAHLHAQPERDHARRCRGSSTRCARLPVAQAVLDGEALWMGEDGPAAFQDTVAQLDADARRRASDVPLRRAARRRRGPARHAAGRARRAARGDRAAGSRMPRCADRRPGRGPSACSTRRSRPGTRAWSSRTRRRCTPPAGAARRGAR